MNRSFLVHKPFHVLYQSTAKGDKKTSDNYFAVPSNAYPARLRGYGSEEFLSATNDTILDHQLLNPFTRHHGEYQVPAEKIPTQEYPEALRREIPIKVKDKVHDTVKAVVSLFSPSPGIAQRCLPVRYRKTAPEGWPKIILTEGKNRQVRKITAAVGLRALRLIDHRIGVTIENISRCEMLEKNQQDLYNLLRLKDNV